MNGFGKVLIGLGVILIGLGVIVYALTTQKVESTETSTVTSTAHTTTSAPAQGDVGIVKVTGPATTVAFAVDDGATAAGTPPTWQPGDTGDGTQAVTLTLTEVGGREVVVTTVTWTLFNATGAFVATGTERVSTTIAANGTATVSFDITLSETDANTIDRAPTSGTLPLLTPDQSGSGKFTFTITGFDTVTGAAITPIVGVADMSVAVGT